MTTHKLTERADRIRQARALLTVLDKNGIGDDERTLARTVGRLEETVHSLLKVLDEREG